MNLCVVTNRIHPEDVNPNVILPYAESAGTTAVLDAVKVNLAMQAIIPRMVKLETLYSYDMLFRELWAIGAPFILVEHDIIPWPGSLAQLWTCPEPWCGFTYPLYGEYRNYLGCTKFEPARLGECPLPEGTLVSFEGMDRIIEKTLLMRAREDWKSPPKFKHHLHTPPVAHLNINHSRMRNFGELNPYFWESETR
jgi:hypothetical protein